MNDTYFAARLYIDNPSWSGIPFYIRTGKRIGTKSTKIVIEFKNNLKQTDTLPTDGMTPNLLVFEISPNEGISLMVNMKNPSTNQFEPATLTSPPIRMISQKHMNFFYLMRYAEMQHSSPIGKKLNYHGSGFNRLLEAFQENTLPLYHLPCRFNGAESC